MKCMTFDVGRVVLSKQGHDKGGWFLVVKVQDEKHVLIADGATRKLEKPKKKQIKHLRPKPARCMEIAAALEDGKPLLDSDVRKALMAIRQAESKEDQGQRPPCREKEECAFVQE